MKATIDMFQFFNNYRNKRLFIPLVTQRSYAWDEERVDLFLDLICEHVISETDYYFTTVAVRELTKELQKIGDGGNRVVTYIILVSSLVNFIQRNREKIDEMYKDDISIIDYHIKSFNDIVLWKDITKQIPRILLEDEDDMNSLTFCLLNSDKIYKVKKNHIIENYINTYKFYEELFLDEKNALSIITFIEKGLNKITTIVEECETEEEETELFFLKNANIGVQLQSIDTLGNSFNGYMRKYENDEEKIKELQKKNRECFIRLKRLFKDSKLFTDGYKKSFFTMFCYYLGVESKKSLVPYKEVSRKLDKFIKDVLSGKKTCKLFNSPETLLDTFSYFIDTSVKMAQKNFPEFKYNSVLKDFPQNSTCFILAIDLLTNKYNISDEDKLLFLKYSKKIFILHTFKKAGAHPENIFCGILNKCIKNAKENKTELKEEINNEFKRIKKNILDNDISCVKIKSYIEHDGVYKKKGLIKLIFNEINEVLDTESHLRPFNIANDDLTIEHICPQSLYESHPNLHKIGNLCILSKKTNSSFSNRANWKNRYDIYMNCPWALNRTIYKYKDKFSLDEEFTERNDMLCNAFVKAMEIDGDYDEYNKIEILEPVYVEN